MPKSTHHLKNVYLLKFVLLMGFIGLNGYVIYRYLNPEGGWIGSKAESTVYTAKVSKDGVNYRGGIVITKGEGYYMKMTPAYGGPLEAKLEGSGRPPSLWKSATGEIIKTDGQSGVVRVGSEDLGDITVGMYTASFRPYVEGGTNYFTFSNPITVYVIHKDASSITPVVQVSKDNITYSNSIEISKGSEYYLKINPAWFGPLEAKLGSSTPGKWFWAYGGVVHVTKEDMKNVAEGTYTATFRPWIDSTVAINPYKFSNSATVKVTGIAVTAKVSKDNLTYTSSIETTKALGYYLKISPSYTGYLEAQLNGSVSKWLYATNGVAHATPDTLQNASVGTYVAKFRPMVSSGVNPYSWSNETIVVIKDYLPLSVQVSPNNTTYSTSAIVYMDKGYYLKINPAYTGYLEAQFGVAAPIKWYQAQNGLVYIKSASGTITSGLEKEGDYSIKLRSWLYETNPNPWSNTIKITVKAPVMLSAIYNMPVLNISYIPTNNNVDIDKATTGDLPFNTVAGLKSAIASLTNDAKGSLTSASIYKGYDLTKPREPSLSYSIYRDVTYLEKLPTGFLLSDPDPFDPSKKKFRPDYIKILQRENICDLVDNKGVKEVWLWGYHSATIVPAESNMSGGKFFRDLYPSMTHFDISNSERTDDLPKCNNTYVLYNYNYGRGLGEVLENHGHQIESVAREIDTSLFGVFTGNCGQNQPYYGCGNIHIPPNMMINGKFNASTNGCYGYDYQWHSTVARPSVCMNWDPSKTSYPSTEIKQVSCLTWGKAYSASSCVDDAGAAYKIWWMQNLPGRNNTLYYQNKKLVNWWTAIADLESLYGQGFVNTQRLRR